MTRSSFAIAFAVTTTFTLLVACQTSAQVLGGLNGRSSYPSQEYFLGLSAMREGAIPDAIDTFESAVRSGRTNPNGKWIDSIPAYTMLGECHYQAGNLRQAHQNFDAAIQLMLRNQEWVERVRWPTVLPGGRSPIAAGNWATTSRRSTLANVPADFQYLAGSLNPLDTIQRGGTLETTQYLQINVAEIFRSLAWCISRRTQLMGPLAIDEPMTEQLIGTLKSARIEPNTVGQAWRDLVLGMALISDNQPEQAIPLIERSTQLAGNLDHPLTPIALLTLGNLFASVGKPASTTYYLEAALSGAAWGQYEVTAEAFRLAAGPLAARGSADLLNEARNSAVQLGRRSRLIAANNHLVAAELAAASGQLDTAKRSLGDARTVLARRNVVLPRLDAYANYILALSAFQSGDLRSSSKALDSAMAFAFSSGQRTASPHRYQLGMVSSALSSGAIGSRTADELLEKLSGGPSIQQWYRDPIDALSATKTSQGLSELRVAAYLQRQKNDDALQAADLLLGDRFRNQLPLSGRLLDLRWLMSGDPSVMSEDAQKIRQNPPEVLKALAGRVAETTAIKKLLGGLPLIPGADPKSEAMLKQGWVDLASAGERAEMLVGEIAIRRMSIPRMFPPEIGEQSSWPTLAAGNGVLTFCPAGKNLVAFLMTEGKVIAWRVEKPLGLSPTIKKLVSELGVVRRRGGASQLAGEDKWQTLAGTLRKQLLSGIDPKRLTILKRLVIVPYGSLWYLPFELLPVNAPDGPRLGDVMAISYAPTPGLAMNVPPGVSSGKETGCITGRLFAQDLDISTQYETELIETIDGTVRIPTDVAIPSGLLSTRLARMWVASHVVPQKSGALNTSLTLFDQVEPGGPLRDWLRYPWGAPREVLLPGYQSLITTGGATPTGEDLFLTTCGLQAAGVRSILISRWPVGGPSTASLMREYLNESPFASPLESLSRSRALLRAEELDPTLEPILSKDDADGRKVTGNHPLFWAGYMMVGAELEKVNP